MKSVIEYEFNYNVKDVWDVVTNNEDYKWRSDIEKLEIVDDLHFIEFDKNGYEVKFKITDKREFEYYAFDVSSKNIKGTWTGEFISLDNNKTKIIFTEDMETSNFIMKLFLKKFMSNTQKQYMKDLESKLLKL